jgi:divalent metal cation (Fe/Co/Zn/Cd) transporter
MYALAEDSRNDVASNIVALACGLTGMILFHSSDLCRSFKYMIFLAYHAFQNNIKQEAIVVDPIGAILISVYIIIAWILQANSESQSFNCI